MKKALVIHYHFPPLLGRGRFETIKHLPVFGWNLHVICASENVNYPKDYDLLQQIPDGVEVNRVGHRERSRVWQYAWSYFKLKFDFPDDYKTWYSLALKEAREILQKEKVDLIFSSSPPFTNAFVAKKLKREFNLPWVAEFRDPWVGNTYLNLSLEKTLIKPLRKWLKFRIKRAEREILESADKVNVVSPSHKKQLCELYQLGEDRIEVVTNGYNESDFTELKPYALYPDKLTILFMGGIYIGFREIILKLLKAVTEIDQDVEVVLMGRGAAGFQDINMPNLTRILYVQPKKALSFASRVDYSLLITLPTAKYNFPTGLFEYLRLGKPILALVPEDGDAAKVIREAKAGFILSYDEEEMKEQLRKIFARCRRGEFDDFHPDRDYVAQFERRKLTEKLAHLFDEAVGGK
jgi:glycosyltransferase involved in cell wall biosynthesis